MTTQLRTGNSSTIQVPKAVCPKCGCTEMWESIQKEIPPEPRWYGVRYFVSPGDVIWVHICIRCGRRFEQPA